LARLRRTGFVSLDDSCQAAISLGWRVGTDPDQSITSPNLSPGGFKTDGQPSSTWAGPRAQWRDRENYDTYSMSILRQKGGSHATRRHP